MTEAETLAAIQTALERLDLLPHRRPELERCAWALLVDSRLMSFNDRPSARRATKAGGASVELQKLARLAIALHNHIGGMHSDALEELSACKPHPFAMLHDLQVIAMAASFAKAGRP